MPHSTSRLFLAALLLALVAPGFASAAGGSPPQGSIAEDPEAIADVAAGRIRKARAVWWGFDPADATGALQAALDSPASTIVIEDVGRPWIVTPIRLPGDKVLVLEEDVVVEAKRGAFLDKGACLFSAKGCKRLTIRGPGATLRMHKQDYHRPPYAPAEWRHAISIRGCEQVRIEGLTLRDSGGDGIYLGAGTRGATNRDVIIRNVVCDGNNRQGISVITAEKLLIEDCVFRSTEGTAPQAGIDFEPNRPDERLVDCVLRNCRSEGNAGHAYHIYLGNLHQDSPPVSIRFEDCASRNCGRYSAYAGVANRKGLRTVRGTIEYLGCRFDSDQGGGVYIRGNEADGCRVRFERCEIIRGGDDESPLAPISIEAPRALDIDAGNVQLVDCTVRDARSRRPLDLIASPLTRLRNLSGSLTVVSPAGEREVTLDARQLAEWFPAQGVVERIPRRAFDWRKAAPARSPSGEIVELPRLRLRRSAALLAWAAREEPLRLGVELQAIRGERPAEGEWTVQSPGGEPRRIQPAREGDLLTCEFTPEASGTCLIRWQADSSVTMRPLQCNAPLGLLCEPAGLSLFRPAVTLYFAVPADVSRFAIQVAGAGTAETVRATIRDGQGRLVDAHDNIAPPHVFVLESDRSGSGGVWSVQLEKAATGVLEDVSLQTLGIPPAFGFRPQSVFQ